MCLGSGLFAQEERSNKPWQVVDTASTEDDSPLLFRRPQTRFTSLGASWPARRCGFTCREQKSNIKVFPSPRPETLNKQGRYEADVEKLHVCALVRPSGMTLTSACSGLSWLLDCSESAGDTFSSRMRCKVFGLNQLPFLAGLTAAQKQVIVKAMEVLRTFIPCFHSRWCEPWLKRCK